MNNARSKVLILVEGEKTDYRLMNRLLQIYGISDSHIIISYNTNIYVLYNMMFRDGDPSSIDILQSLKEHERDQEKKKIFDDRYSDILLIFDLDPQDPSFSANKILEMSSFFVESSDMGKLYLNYPMVESFYHMKSIPDAEYYTYTVSLEELRTHQYKKRVSEETRNINHNKFVELKEECDIVIKQNIGKAWIIANKKQSIEAVDEFPPNSIDILEAQLKYLETRQKVAVLCTCVFYIVDYNPSLLQ